MKKQNLWLIVAVLLIGVVPLWLVPLLGIGPGAVDSEAAFRGADERAQQLIQEISPGYQPWFNGVMRPASDEIATLLFALQAAIGAGFIGYWLGCALTRDRLRRQGDSSGKGSPARAD